MTGERIISIFALARRFGSPVVVVAAFYLSALLGGAGCSQPALPAAPHRFVRIDSLLALHPSYEQIRSFDREIGLISADSRAPHILAFQPHAAIKSFTPRASLPGNLAAERAKQIDLDVKRYVDSLRKSLANANQSVIALTRRREQRRAEAAVAVRLADAAKSLQAVNEVKLFAIRQRIGTLTLRDVVVRSQVQDLAQARTADLAPLRAAQGEHLSILQDLARLRSEDAALRKLDVSTEVTRQRDSIYRDELARSRERVAKREEELRVEMQDKLSAAALRQHETDLQPASPAYLPPPDPHTTPLPLNPGLRSVSLTSTKARDAAARQSLLWQAQRMNLIAEIRADTLKAVEQIAARRGWRLDSSPLPGTIDGTAEAADELRAQWRMGK